MIVRDLLIRLGFQVDGGGELPEVDKRLKDIKKTILGIIGALGILQAGKWMVNTIRESEKLEAQLQTVLGSADAATKKMAELRAFSTSTPFQLSDIVKGFNALEAANLKPSMDDMKAFGDIAAATGKNYSDIGEALRGASVGEMERLKAFNISAKMQGKNIEFMYKGVKKVVKRDSAAIKQYIVDLGKTQFTGGMARQAKTINGAISNLKDNLAAMAVEVGKSGFAEQLNLFIRELTGVSKGGKEAAQALGRGLADALALARDAIIFLRENFLQLKVAIGGVAAAWLAFQVGFAASTIAEGAKGIITLTKLMKALKIEAMLTAAPYLLIGAAILGLILLFQDLWTWATGGESVVAQAFDSLGNSLAFVKTLLMGLAIGLAVFFFGIPAAIAVAVAGIVILIVNYLDEIIDYFKFFGMTIYKGFILLGRWIVSIWDWVVEKSKSVWVSFSTWIGGIFKTIGETFSSFIDGILEKVNKVADIAKKASNIVGGSADFLMDGAMNLFSDGATSPALDRSARGAAISNNASSNVNAPINITVVSESGDAAEIAEKTSSSVRDSMIDVTARAASDFAGSAQ